MTLTERENGRRIQLRREALLTLRLSENPTTGFRWQVEDLAGLELVGDRFEGAATRPGAGGARVFELRATAPGVHNIQLRNFREWEPGKAAGTFQLEVVVP